MAALYAVIMAGGRGERFWPLSTRSIPKPFIPLLGSSTLLQDTVARIQRLVPVETILISIGAEHSRIARQQLPQLPEENFIVEPTGRDTAACLGFSALHIERRDPAAVMLALPADHFIGDADAYVRTVQKGLESLEGSSGVVFGIAPTRPETGYGYILAAKPERPEDAWSVSRFIEKPDAATAERYLASGNYFWNSGIFLWENRVLLELFQKHMPDTHQGLCRLRPLLGRSGSTEDIGRIFAALPRISIDFGIMEKVSGLRLVPAQFVWDDIGNWASLERALPADDQGNIAQGVHVALESSGCILYAQSGTVTVFGVSDLIVVQAHGKVLVCSKDRAADLKKLVSALGTVDE
ncbi:MAG: mannose-1-phosphate guanylyltransferase [Acidobacteria bacterium]|nr:mannose-1-phosphate guanylyltransferase [Acidobacteriota bacterium]